MQRHRLFILLGSAGLLLGLAALSTLLVRASLPEPRTIYVGPRGADTEEAGQRADTPYRTIGYALTKVAPGTTMRILPGTYREALRTSISGTRRRPIRLLADGAVRLRGDGSRGRIFEVTHDHYIIEGFDFAGADILLWLQGASHAVIRNNVFHDADGECVRFKYHSQQNIFADNRVEDCGLDDFTRGGSGKNGEGIYLGTAPEQLNRNPTVETDRTNDNLIRNNTFVTNGNECVDIKEGAEQNVVEFNDCTGQRDAESGGFDARGSRNTFRYNISRGNAGAGIRFGGDEKQDGLKNEAYGNLLIGNAGYALKVMRTPQGTICGNILQENAKGATNEKNVTNPSCDFPLSPPGHH